MLEMNTFLKDFGQTLKSRRKEMSLSQVTAAQNMKIDYRHYQNIEGGKINLRLDTMMKLVNFYNLTHDRSTFNLNLNAFLDLLTGSSDESTHCQNWNALYEHFVRGGHAGYMVIDSATRTITDVNERLFQSLGHLTKVKILGQPVDTLANEQGLAKMDQFCKSNHTETVSEPFIVTFKTQPPAFLKPMMTLIRLMRDPASGQDRIECMFFDRQTLDDEGHRLVEIVSGYKQFMELYPQLKAV